MDKPLTPEKQLLKLIEEPAVKSSLQAAALKHQGLSLFSQTAWLGRLAFFNQGFGSWLGNLRQRGIDIKAVNNLLAFAVGALTLCFLGSFFISLMNFRKIPNVELKAEALKQPVNLQESDALKKKTAAYYLEKLASRDIFKMGPKEKPQGALAVKASPAALLEATENFKLVGISWSDDPDAMIEDTKFLKTFFVKRGQMVGEFKVQAIFKDKVILSYGQEEIELK